MTDLLTEKIKKTQSDLDEVFGMKELKLSKYPDLQIFKDRWGNELLYSKKVNPIATEWTTGHSCGCCADAALYLYVFVHEVNPKTGTKIKVYSDPPQMCIGQKDYTYGDFGDSGWEEKVRKLGICEEVIKAVGESFESDRIERERILESEDSSQD